MANFPGISGYIQPTTISRVRTLQRALSIPGGIRTLAIIGEGAREETIIESAQGGGADGFKPDYTTVATSSDGYGRYFTFANTNLVSGRTELYLNSQQLNVLEETIDVTTTFDDVYDARVDTTLGRIELQGASLEYQGGSQYLASTSNRGDGYLSSISVQDANAPGETWTVKCISTIQDGNGNPIRGQATFTATGSVSGQQVDSYGQVYQWQSDGYAVNNGILSFSIFNLAPNAVFQAGDFYTINVASRVLQNRDQLTASYIATIDLEDPESFTEPSQLFAKHGQASEANTLSLAAQIAYENGAPSIMAVQAKPALPRRTTETVLPAYDATTGLGGASGGATADDLIFDITSPGKPKQGTSINFFVLNSSGTETQIFPNAVQFYGSSITTAFSNYEDTGSSVNLMAAFMNPAVSSYTYSYTVVSDDKIELNGFDAVITPILAGLTCSVRIPSQTFDANDIGKSIDFQNALAANTGRFAISSVTDANTIVLTRSIGAFVSETSVQWQLLSSTGTSQRVLLTTDLALPAQRGLKVTYIDENDYDFYDSNWSTAISKLETQDLSIVTAFPTQTYSAIQQALRVHCERMSASYYKKERLMIMGAISGLTTANVLGTSNTAVEDLGVLEGIQGDSAAEILAGNTEDLTNYSVSASFGSSFRVIYMYPDQIWRVISGTRTTIDGFWMAAALGGWFSGVTNIAMPGTYKTLSGFTIPNSKVYTRVVQDQLGQAGITLVEPVTGGGRMMHCKTTTSSGLAEEEEPSIVFIKDRVAQVFRSTFLSFVGQPEDPTLVPSLTALAIGTINAFISEGIITDFRNLTIARDPVDPRQWNVTVELQPNYPVNWIFIDVSVGLLTT